MDYYVCNKQYGSLKSSKITTCFAKRAKLQKQDPTKDVGGVLDTRSAKKILSKRAVTTSNSVGTKLQKHVYIFI